MIQNKCQSKNKNINKRHNVSPVYKLQTYSPNSTLTELHQLTYHALVIIRPIYHLITTSDAHRSTTPLHRATIVTLITIHGADNETIYLPSGLLNWRLFLDERTLRNGAKSFEGQTNDDGV